MRTTVVVIGAGQSGLAMSWWLAARSIDHVVLERGEIANTWRTERWDSLTLLTPNWQSRLPGFGYEGDDPDGFRTMGETVAFIERYAQVVSAPLRTHCPVTSVRRTVDGYEVVAGQGTWHCKAVVLATGAFNIAQVPKRLGRSAAGHRPAHHRSIPQPGKPRDGRRHGRRRGRLGSADRR